MFASIHKIWLIVGTAIVFGNLVQTHQDPSTGKASYCYSKDKNRASSSIAWKCNQQSAKCIRVHALDSKYDTLCLTSLDVCNLLCHQYASLWPLPTGNFFVQKNLLPVNSVYFNYTSRNNNKQLEKLEKYFVSTLGNWSEERTAIKIEDTADVKIEFLIKNELEDSLTLATAENYKLLVATSKDKNITKQINVTIEADNYFGARHGIETLLQLFVKDEISRSLLIPTRVNISDVPIYRHRGLLLDTSRSFYSVKAIKRLLDGMAYNKLNVFHWHLTDSHSFPFQSKNFPEMHKFGAYSPTQVYTWLDIKDIVEYARVRGIKVLPELDTPSHVGEGWQHFEKDVLLCFNSKPWIKYCAEPPCGVLNPINDRVYQILGALYSELNELFDSDTFHMGGDEIKYACWEETNSIIKWLSDRNKSRSNEGFLHLWAHFQNQTLIKFDESAKNAKNKKIILWSSFLTESKSVKEFLDPNRYIIQIWTSGRDKHISDVLNNGYQIIISNYDALYLDCGFGSVFRTGTGNNWCSPYKSWQQMYANDPMNLVNDLNNWHPISNVDYQAQILGAEAALWSEQADEHNMDAKIWPRAAAVAERLWSSPITGWELAENRLLRQRERMVSRGIDAELIEPLWCHQNEDQC